MAEVESALTGDRKVDGLSAPEMRSIRGDSPSIARDSVGLGAFTSADRLAQPDLLPGIFRGSNPANMSRVRFPEMPPPANDPVAVAGSILSPVTALTALVVGTIAYVASAIKDHNRSVFDGLSAEEVEELAERVQTFGKTESGQTTAVTNRGRVISGYNSQDFIDRLAAQTQGNRFADKGGSQSGPGNAVTTSASNSGSAGLTANSHGSDHGEGHITPDDLESPDRHPSLHAQPGLQADGRPGIEYPDAYRTYLFRELRALASARKIPEEVAATMISLVITICPVTRALHATHLSEAVTTSLAEALKDGAEVYYAEVDMGNLSGLGLAMDERNGGVKGSGYLEANKVFGSNIDLLRNAMEAAFGRENISIVRKGGDEFGVIVSGKNLSAEAMESALERARSAVKFLAEKLGLSNIPHPKNPGARGLDLYWGISEIPDGLSFGPSIARAAEAVEVMKSMRNASAGKAENRAVKTLPDPVQAPTQEDIGRSRGIQGEVDAHREEHGIDSDGASFLSPTEFYRRLFHDYTQIYHLTEPQASALWSFVERHRVAVDPVTGLEPTSERGETFYRIQAWRDLGGSVAVGRINVTNFPGLNSHDTESFHGPSSTNVLFRTFAETVLADVRNIGGNVTALGIRRPGPWFEVVAFGARQSQLDQALQNASHRISDMVRARGLDRIPHPAWYLPDGTHDDSQVGTGIVFNTTEIRAGETIEDWLYRLDSGAVEAERLRLGPSVARFNEALRQQQQQMR